MDLLPAAHTIPAVDHLDIRDRCIKEEMNLVLELRIEILQHDIIDIRSQMTHGRIQEIQFILQAKLLEVCTRRRVHLRALPAVFHVDLVHILHQPDRPGLADVLIQCPAKIIRYIVLSVGECSRTAKTAHDRTAPALDTALYLVAVDRTVPLVKRMPRLKNRYFQITLSVDHLVCREDTARPRTYYYHIVTHTLPRFLYGQSPVSRCRLSSGTRSVRLPIS